MVGAYFLIVELLTPALASVFELDGHYPTGGPVMAYVAIALISLLGLLAALKRLLAGRPAVRETLIRVALLTPLGALAGIAGAVAVARAPDYTATEANAYMQVLFLVCSPSSRPSVSPGGGRCVPRPTGTTRPAPHTS